jgi:hypothetical protein
MKVYLSRSNASDPEVCSYVRKRLEQLGLDIIEFHGGVYNKQSVLEGEYLIIVPPRGTTGPKLKDSDGNKWDYLEPSSASSYYIGRGQTEQIQEFLKEKDNTEVLLVESVHVDKDGEIRVYTDNLGDVNVEQSNWEDQWASLDMDSDTDLVENKLGIDPDAVVAKTTSIMVHSGNVMLGAAKLCGVKL